MRIANQGVTSAVITLNGRTVLGPEDFRRNEPLIVRSIAVRAGTNTISVELRGQPGTSLTVDVSRPESDTTPPTISATATPPPNANGWNNTTVNVSFACADADSGVATCSPPVSVAAEGANQRVSGTALDKAGNTASATLTVNIDKTLPSVAVSSPTGGATVSSSEVTITGSVADAGSGVVQLTCNGVATTPQSPFSCDVPLNPGVNSLVVEATDGAGNRQSTPVSLTYDVSNVRVMSFSPQSGSAGTLVTLSGESLAPNTVITLNRIGGGTIDAPTASASAASVRFVIPAGAASGPIRIASAHGTATSATPLTVATSTDFDVIAQPSSATMVPGQSISFAVSLSSDRPFEQLASLVVEGAPATVTARLTPDHIAAGQTSVLTLTAPASQPLGSIELTVTGSATVDGVVVTRSVTVQVTTVSATTSFMGRTVVADAVQTPLAGVTVTMLGKNGNGGTTNCSGETVSDAAGNFALTGLGVECVGPQLVGYDGLTVTSPPGEYAGVNLVYTLIADQATTSSVLVNLPRIDDKETFLVRQNVSTEQTFNYKSIPGLSVTVYPGTTFTLEDGSRPDPFPLVAVQVPVDRLPDDKPPVPTMLQVFIVAFQPANAVASRPAAVFYPNTVNIDPGVNMTMMTLNPTLGRMVPYGTATVSADGKQIVPDLDPSSPGARYGIVHFDWHGPMPPVQNAPPPNRPPVSPPAPSAPPERCPPQVGQPCDLTSGLETVTATDIALSGPRGTVAVVRSYRTLSINPGPFGLGTNHNYNYFLSVGAPQNALQVNLILPQGTWLPFSRSSITTPFVNDTTPSLQGMSISTFADGRAELRRNDGSIYRFAAGSPLIVPALESITDANGNRTTLVRDPTRPMQVTEITDPVGRRLLLAYDAENRITTITDPIGRVVRYTYTTTGMLETVTNPEAGVTRYEYDAENRLVKHTNARGLVIAQNSYESHGRVAEQIQADGGAYRFDYTFVNPTVETTQILSTRVTDPMGKAMIYRFTPDAFLTDVQDNLGQRRLMVRDPQQANQVTAYKRAVTCESCGNDPSPGDVAYEYDLQGNPTKRTDAIGRSTRFTYDLTFNKVASVTDAAGNTAHFTYDGRGNLSSRTDANSKTTSYEYDNSGQLLAVTDALGRKTRFSYDTFGNVIRITDALGNVTTFVYDGVSRLLETRNSLGRTEKFEYDRLDRVVKQTDAQNNVITFSYDAVGNLASLRDARGKITSFTYDPMNRLLTKTDPLGKTETRTYDLNGNLLSVVDRRGQTSTFVYDGLDRLVEERYADAAVVKRSYDASDRLVQVDDSAGGVFSFSYDLAGSLLSSTGPTGSVKYVRDALGRVEQRQVVGQSAVNYAYDPVGNMLSAAMPEASVSYTYDALNRPSGVTRMNGVSTAYSYDPVGQLMSIVHSRGTSTLLSLAYSYDTTGARVSQQTSSSQSLVTQPATATYDDANRLVQRGASTFTYDDSGNLISEVSAPVTKTYTWDGRNRLSRIVKSDGQTTDFTYDFAGNLIRQTDAGPLANVTKSFTLDDVTDVVFQQSSDGEQFSVLTGRTLDSHFATVRTANDVEFALTDSINSTVVTVDQAGATKGHFSYESFGETTFQGSTFPFQYTGRVPVNEDLYHYRARYYSAGNGRFVSEDPIGFASGDANLYRYVTNDPYAFNDPKGTVLEDTRDSLLGLFDLTQAVNDIAKPLSNRTAAYGGMLEALDKAARGESISEDCINEPAGLFVKSSWKFSKAADEGARDLLEAGLSLYASPLKTPRKARQGFEFD